MGGWWSTYVLCNPRALWWDKAQWLVWANGRATREHVEFWLTLGIVEVTGNLQNRAALKGLLAGEKLVKVSIGGPQHMLSTTQPAKSFWVLGLCVWGCCQLALPRKV